MDVTGGPLFEDEFTQGEPLGKGHFSVVYRCTDDKRGGDYAVKVIEKLATSTQQLGDVMREVQILQTLGGHQCLCGLHRYYSSQEYLHIVLDLIDGPPLFNQIVKLKHYSEKDAATITRHLLEGVCFMASKSICHRDLKPENIILAHQPREGEVDLHVKIVDFGFAEVASDSNPQLTKCCGTPLYIAPEILNCGLFKTGGPYGIACDMWSLGVITYILICGYAPFCSRSNNEQFKKIVKGVYSFPPHKVWGQVTDGAKEFISGLLVLDPLVRRNAFAARDHAWVCSVAVDDGEAPPDENLDGTVGNLREFNAQQKWRKGIFGVEAITRMRYAALCREMRVRPNSDIERILMEATSPLNVVDLSANYLGPKGLLALLPLVEQNSAITALIFGRNGVNNTVVEKLCQVVRKHPAVRVIDLSENPISHMAGRYLLHAVQANQGITEVGLKGTMLHESAVSRIEAQLQRNRLRAADPAGHRQSTSPTWQRGSPKRGSGSPKSRVGSPKQHASPR